MAKEQMYYTMPDGTIKQINPFTGTQVWTVPGRARRPGAHAGGVKPEPLEPRDKEDYCAFCESRRLETPPEKERLVLENGEYRILKKVSADKLTETKPVFRRISNLFEIVTMDYWEKNYGYTISGENQKWKEEYLSNPAGREHVLKVINNKLKGLGKTKNEIESMPQEAKFDMANAFFAGSHELVIKGEHYKPDAKTTADLYSSGNMSPREHFEYMKFTIGTMKDIYEKNRYARYVSVFQNWLKSAGASFDHLHKQLVAVDEWGLSVEKEIALLQRNNNIYNEKVVNFACYHNFILAENDYAIAFADFGHRYPTLAIYSKSRHGRPYEHTDEELRGFSDIVHACHRASGSHISCNEEWYYTPRDALTIMPWHILIKWRVHMHAGFEGGTRIYINPYSPQAHRDLIVPNLYDLRDKGLIANMFIADECPAKPNCLKYNQ